MKEPKSTATWRDTGRSVKFLFFNARVLAPLVLIVIPGMQGRLFFLLVAVSLGLAAFDFYKITPIVVLRMVRSKIAGPLKVVRQKWM